MATFGLLPSTPLVNGLVVVLASAVVWIGSGWLERGAESLGTHYELPPVIQGSLLVAVGSSFPEFSAVLVAAVVGVFDIGIGAVVGSAIFNVLVIPALAGLAADDGVGANRAIVYKEALFYMLAVSAVIITFALAVIYEPVAAADPLVGEVTRPLAAIPLALYGLYLFVQWKEIDEYQAGDEVATLPVRRAWILLLAGLATILVAVERLVTSVESLSETFGVPTFLAGVVIVAAATSVPDALVSVRTAAAGKDSTSLGNVLGSNTFDLLVAIPVGVMLVGSVTVDFAVALPMLGVLTLATVVLFTALRTGLTLSRQEAVVLLVVYATFIGWVGAETAGLVDLLPDG